MTNFDAVLARRLDDPRVSVGPVVAPLGDQADAVAVALQPETVAVIFFFMNPLSACRHGLANGGDTELKLRHDADDFAASW
jgi:hypothetical protein